MNNNIHDCWAKNGSLLLRKREGRREKERRIEREREDRERERALLPNPQEEQVDGNFLGEQRAFLTPLNSRGSREERIVRTEKKREKERETYLSQEEFSANPWRVVPVASKPRKKE